MQGKIIIGCFLCILVFVKAAQIGDEPSTRSSLLDTITPILINLIQTLIELCNTIIAQLAATTTSPNVNGNSAPSSSSPFTDTTLVCINGNRQAIQGNNTAYQICQNNVWVTVNCEINYLDQTNLICLVTTPTTPVCINGDKFDINSTSYQLCEGGIWITVTCPTGSEYYTTVQDCTDCTSGSPNCISSTIQRSTPSGSQISTTPGPCRNGDRQPIANNPKSYETCVDNVWVKLVCSGSDTYDPISAKCDSTTVGPCNNGDQMTDPSNNTLYKQCVNNTWTVNTCPAGTIYSENNCTKALGSCTTNGESQSVNIKTFKYCSNYTWLEKTCPFGEIYETRTKKCISTYSCIEGDQLSVYYNDTLYLQCDKYGLSWIIYACDKEFVYDPETEQCVYTGTTQACGSGQYFDTHSKQCASDSTSASSIATTARPCINNEKRIYETAGIINHTKYYICIETLWVIYNCPPNQVFNASMNVNPYCTNVTTTTASANIS